MLSVFTLLVLAGTCLAYHPGDYVPAARRGQFQLSMLSLQQRTQWHDIHGQECPRFGKDDLVMVPIPQPRGFRPGYSYKIQLSLDGDRFLTPWLLVMGRTVTGVSFIDVEVTHGAGSVQSVRARALELPAVDAAAHPALAAAWANASHWPKPLVVQYRWILGEDVHTERGLLVVFVPALLLLALVTQRVYRTYRKEVGDFVASVTVAPQPKAD